MNAIGATEKSANNFKSEPNIANKFNLKIIENLKGVENGSVDSSYIKQNGATGQESNIDHVGRITRKGAGLLASQNLKLC